VRFELREKLLAATIFLLFAGYRINIYGIYDFIGRLVCFLSTHQSKAIFIKA
jgi:hypothetical protein